MSEVPKNEELGTELNTEKGARFRAERITEASPENVDRSFRLDEACYPADMMEPRDAYEYILGFPGAVNVALENEQGFCGHALAYDFSDVYDEIANEDLELSKTEKGEALYIYSIAIRPDTEGFDSVRGIEALRTLWDRFQQEVRKTGYKKIIAYARVENGMSKALQRKCGAQFYRRKENWLDMKEAFDYLEIPLK